MPLFGYSYRFYISLAFTLLIIILGSIFSSIFYVQTKGIITDLTSKAFGFTVEETALKTSSLFENAESLVSVIASHEITNTLNSKQRAPHFNFLLRSFSETKNITSVYIAYDDGDFYLVRRLPSQNKRTSFLEAPENTRYVIQISEKDDEKNIGEYRYYDEALVLLARVSATSYGQFDPRTRHWYQLAMEQHQAVTADPYVFFTTKEIGTTIAQKSASERAVIAADISLSKLNKFLSDFKTTPNTKVALLTRGSGVIATVDNTVKSHLTALTPNTPIRLPLLNDKVLEDALIYSETHQQKNSLVEISSSDQDWLSMVRNISLPNNIQYTLVIAIPTYELLSDAINVLINSIIWLSGLLIVLLFVTNKLASKLTKPIHHLVKQTNQVREFNFDKIFDLRSSIKEVNLLGNAMNQMNATITQFIEMNKLLAEEEDFTKLQKVLLDKTIQICDAKAGILYLMDDENNTLIPQVTVIDNIQIRDHQLVPLRINELPKIIKNGIGLQKLIQVEASDAEFGTFTHNAGINSLTTNMKSHIHNLVLVPLYNRQNNLIGCLTLLMENKLHSHHQAFIQAISRNAAISIETRQLIHSQDALFESFIMLLASAIDGKSSYTAEHCKRVPEIMKLLAQAADISDIGPYADFKLTKNSKQAIHVAAWLHDCGKITTPEFVIDKATKLETIYDRLHEIRMRFELVKKETELSFSKRQLAGEHPDELHLELQKELKTIDEEFLLVAGCNQGDVSMDEWTINQINAISKRKWTRTLSDRVGLSHLELARKLRSGTTPTLPTQEYLLADKEEHKILREGDVEKHNYKKMGFNIEQPELLYNRGELYSLLVKRGTLNTEERYKINEHIIQSTLMMDKLNFPKHLRDVPEIACGHHEKMDGTGYPKGLTSEQMSPLAKMMAIADIFEALTSDDRPYKKPNTLSQSMAIMSKMRDSQHIDAELFDLFVENGVYKEYAIKYLDESQIDNIQPEEFLSEKGKLHYFKVTSRFTS